MKILIAEDDSSLRRALTSILQHNNYAVDAVADGGLAFDYLTSGYYDAAILDIMMPVMDGVTVLAKARHSGCDTPVLVGLSNICYTLRRKLFRVSLGDFQPSGLIGKLLYFLL